MLVNHNIKNFSGGVSQQPDEDRFDNQVESMVNWQVTVAQGLRRRNPIELVGAIGLVTSNIAVHSYDRGDGLEKYGMIFDANGLRVFDENGNPKTVNNILYGGFAVHQLWTVSNYRKDIKFLTVGDTTWLLNRNEIVQYSQADPSTSGDVPKAFYWINKSYDNGSGTGYTYQVTLDGNLVSTSATSTITAATNIATAVNALANFSAIAKGSIVRIQRTNNAAFVFESGDSWGNQASTGWYSWYGVDSGVKKISDLPASMSAFSEAQIGTIPITGTDRDDFTNYYVRWQGGKWKEVEKLGFNTVFDYTTLPAKIVRQPNGTFTIGFNTDINKGSYSGFDTNWSDRVCGDDDSNPIPSFANNKISNMFFFKNRLGFTSEENAILSETGSYYNFFATTVMDVIDSDPIDAAVDSNTVSKIRNINATAGALTIWADDAQFILSGGEILSPATTRLAQTSSYSCDNSIIPVVVDNGIIFFNKVGDWLDVLSYDPASLQADKSNAESISSHIPMYLPSTIDTAKVSSAHNMIFLYDINDENTIYVYKYHINGGEKIISAWFKWTFTINIKAIEVLAGVLYLLADDGNAYKIILEPIDISSSFLDADTGLSFTSTVIMSKYNVELRNEVRAIREPFYIKNIKTSRSGLVDLDIINSERASTTNVKSKHVDRRLFIGGNSEKINIGFSTSYDTGCQLDTISIEGRFSTKSRNI